MGGGYWWTIFEAGGRGNCLRISKLWLIGLDGDAMSGDGKERVEGRAMEKQLRTLLTEIVFSRGESGNVKLIGLGRTFWQGFVSSFSERFLITYEKLGLYCIWRVVLL